MPILQLTDKQLTVSLPQEALPLPQIINDVKRAYKGYRVFAGGKWTFYAAEYLNEAEIDDLEEWLEDTPTRKAA